MDNKIDSKTLTKKPKEQIMLLFKKLFKGKKKIIVIAGLLVLLILAGLKIFASQKTKTPAVQTSKAEKGTIVSSVSASGQVLSVNIISANTKASGIVKKVFVKDGDVVKKGDKILEIDLDFQGEQKHAQAWAAYLSAKNSLESAKATQYSLQAEMLGKWDDFKELAESDTYKDTDSGNRNLPEFHILQEEWLAAEAKYKNQQAVINQTQAAINSSWLSYIQTSPVITAPTDGAITSLMYAEGMSIGSLDTGSSESNQKIATIKTQGMPIVSVNLSEIDVSRVELGKKATISLDSIADKTFTGEVIGVDRIGETSSGVTQYPAIIRLDSSALEILPNMTVTANIIIDKKDNVLLVPSSAIQSQNGQSFVQIMVNNKSQYVLVETGLDSDDQTEIISGINEKDLIVTANSSSTESTKGGTSPFGGSGVGGMMRIAH